MNNVTGKTNELIQRWARAKNRVATLRREISGAECEESNARNELGAWLVPKDQPECENFNIWFGSGVIQAKKLKNGNDYDVIWRKEPDGKQKAELGI